MREGSGSRFADAARRAGNDDQLSSEVQLFQRVAPLAAHSERITKLIQPRSLLGHDRRRGFLHEVRRQLALDAFDLALQLPDLLVEGGALFLDERGVDWLSRRYPNICKRITAAPFSLLLASGLSRLEAVSSSS